MTTHEQQAEDLQKDWDNNPRWVGIERTYTAADVVRLRGASAVESTLAKRGAAKLWTLLNNDVYVSALGAMSGGQAIQQVKAGLKSIYLSGSQLAGDPNLAAEVDPDQSLTPADGVPTLVRHIHNTLQHADQIQWSEGKDAFDYFVPIVAEADAGSGGVLNAFELMKSMIDAGAAGVHFDDQLASAKKGGPMSGKVLVPTREAVEKLTAARMAADAMGVSTLIIARTDADGASVLSSDIDPTDREFLTGERTVEGFYIVRPGLEQVIARALAYAPFADMVWCQTGKPDLAYAKQFAAAVHAKFPGKMLAYNCLASFDWKKHLDDATIAKFQKELGAMGYKFQFVTLAGLDARNNSMDQLAHGFMRRGMPAIVELQEAELAAAARGFTAVRQREVGSGYVDAVTQPIGQHVSSTMVLPRATYVA